MAEALARRFFTDQNVPEAVARLLEAEGFEVIRLRETIAVDSPDTQVAAVAEAKQAILVTADDDFKQIARRVGFGKRIYSTLSLLRFEGCRETRMAERLKKLLSLVLHEWEVGGSDKDRRLFVVIKQDVVRSHR